MVTTMAGRTISAYVEDTVAEKVTDLAKREDRTPGQIAGQALRLYMALPNEARNAWRAVEHGATPEDRRWVATELTRVLIQMEFELLHREMAAEIAPRLPANMTEEEIEQLAVEWTSRRG